ncbi:MAG: hypothetical protein ACOYIF_03860 [Acetivibrionales bacterium]|jgi:predicted anti-sigma-YlaC factor YlaD
MDCKQAWKLMMKYFDQEISQIHEKELHAHFDACSFCKTRFEELAGAFTALKTTELTAPPNIEKRVMAGIYSVRSKKDFLMHYVIFNFVVFAGIVTAWLDNIYKIGIYIFIKEVFNEVIAAYNTSSAVFTTFWGLSSTYLIKPAINIIIIAILIYGILNIVITLQKMRRRRFSVR